MPDICKAINVLMNNGIRPKVTLYQGNVWYQREALVAFIMERSNLIRPQIIQALDALEMDLQQPDRRIYINGDQQRWKVLDAQKMCRLIEEHVTPNKAFGVLFKERPSSE